MRSSFLASGLVDLRFILIRSCDHLFGSSCFRDVVQMTSSSSNSSVDSKPHTTFPCFIISSWQWVGLLFFIKRFCKLTEECLFCLLLVTTFLGMDFSEGFLKIFSQFLSTLESDKINVTYCFIHDWIAFSETWLPYRILLLAKAITVS